MGSDASTEARTQVFVFAWLRTSPDGKGTAVEDSALQNCIKLKSEQNASTYQLHQLCNDA